MYFKTKSFPFSCISLCAPVLIVCLYFLFHFHFMQRFIDWDQIWYTNNIRNMMEGSVPYFNPHHIHYESGGKIFHEFMIRHFKEAGFTDLMFNNRLRSLLVSCIGIFFLMLYIKEMTGKLMWGILGGLLVGFCHAYLSYSTQSDTPIFPASAFCVLLYLMKKLETEKKRPLLFAFISGIVCAIGVVFHQYAAFACAAAVISILLPPVLFGKNQRSSPFILGGYEEKPLIDKKPVIRYKAVLIISITGISLICASYFYTGKTIFNLPFDKPNRKTAIGRYSYTTFQKWLFLYQDEGWWANGFKKYDPRNSFRGYTNTFLSPTTSYKYLRYVSKSFKYDVTNPGNDKAFAYNQVAYFTVIPLAGIFIFFPFFWKRYKRSLFFLLTSFGIFSFFTTYWEASYFEFWFIPCIASCVLAILFLNFIGENCSILLKKVAQFPFYLLVFIFLISLSSHNVYYYLIPYSRKRHMEDVYLKWEKDYYIPLFSDPVYRFPENPYKNLYKTKPVR